MSRSDDLLALASKMANYKKADLQDARSRKAISAAYYALFHLLLEHAAAKLVSHPGVRKLVGRAYSHTDMVKTARTFRSGSDALPNHLKSPFGMTFPNMPAEIVNVANAFIELQEARQDADYDQLKEFSRADAKRVANRAALAFTDWNRIGAMPEHRDICELFLASLLLGDRWKK